MPAGIAGINGSHYWHDQKPPTLMHPASPKVKAAKLTEKSDQNIETASIASTSTFSSTMSLIKKAKGRLSTSSSRKSSEDNGVSRTSERKTLTPKQQTAQDYMIMATMK